ncbi:DUF4125 family protein [Chloroflexota bacterium]
MNREELLKEITDIELRMFLSLQTVYPSACQEQPETFRLMRTASFKVLSDETLESYLEDVREALDENRNLMELKYARIDNLIPCLNENPLIDKIVEIEGRWLEELAGRYPHTFRGRTDYSAGIYLRSELETYSDKTLELYHRDVSGAAGEGRNLTEERYRFIFQQAGYESIDDMESERRQAA